MTQCFFTQSSAKNHAFIKAASQMHRTRPLELASEEWLLSWRIRKSLRDLLLPRLSGVKHVCVAGAKSPDQKWARRIKAVFQLQLVAFESLEPTFEYRTTGRSPSQAYELVLKCPLDLGHNKDLRLYL